jgi:hypothetical protein
VVENLSWESLHNMNKWHYYRGMPFMLMGDDKW